MKFIQQRGRLNKIKTEIELLDTGINYSFIETFFNKIEKKNLFFNYSGIINEREIYVYKNKIISSIYIIITFIIFISFVIFTINDSSSNTHISAFSSFIMKYEAGIFWGYVLICYLLYRIFFQIKLLKISNNGGHFSLIIDKSTENIVKEIYSNRDRYFRSIYLKDKNIKDSLSPETIDYLYSLSVIDESEYKELIKKAKSRFDMKDKGNTGFN